MIKLKDMVKEYSPDALKGKESIRRKPLTSIETGKLFRTDFSQAYDRRQEYTLLRFAEKGKAERELVTPTAQERTSKDANNLYTVLLGALPSWKGWPRRSFSLIASLRDVPSEDNSGYGEWQYRVYP